MKKIIFKKLLNEILIFFIIASLALTLIIWVIQAVNYLDIVTEDGHSFEVYFYYTILSIPKLFSQSLPFVFFVSIFYVLVDYENKNQLLIYWTHGVTKKYFINKIIKFSIFFLLIQIIFSVFIIPFTQDKSRSYIRESNLDFFPNLIKPKKFIDTVKNLTIFIDSKDDVGHYSNIILKEDNGNGNFQIVVAKSGRISLVNNKKILILNDGKIIRTNENKNSTVFNFKVTQFDLNRYSTKTTRTPKIQEIPTIKLIRCLDFLTKNIKVNIKPENFNCEMSFLVHLKKELLKRIYMPAYIILIALISSLLILQSKDSHNYSSFKIKVFLTGIAFLVISDISLNFSAATGLHTLIFLMIPIISFLTIYQILTLKLKVNK